MSKGKTLTLSPGTYNINSITLAEHSVLAATPTGQVIINIAGNNVPKALNFNEGSIVNPAGIPKNFQFVYRGTHTIKLAEGAITYAVLFAPNAPVTLSEDADWYGALIVSTLAASGGSAIHYDRSLPAFVPEVAHFNPGTEVAVTSPQTISPFGGTVHAPPGSPLAGVSVEIPAGALPINSDISLSLNTGTVTTVAGTHSGINIVLHSSTVTTFAQPVSITIPFSPSQGIPVPYFIDESGRLHLVQLLSIDPINNTRH